MGNFERSHPAYKEEDLEIKTPEEMISAKEKAGVTTHKDVMARFLSAEGKRTIEEEVYEGVNLNYWGEVFGKTNSELKAKIEEKIKEREKKEVVSGLEKTKEEYKARKALYDIRHEYAQEIISPQIKSGEKFVLEKESQEKFEQAMVYFDKCFLDLEQNVGKIKDKEIKNEDKSLFFGEYTTLLKKTIKTYPLQSSLKVLQERGINCCINDDLRGMIATWDYGKERKLKEDYPKEIFGAMTRIKIEAIRILLASQGRGQGMAEALEGNSRHVIDDAIKEIAEKSGISLGEAYKGLLNFVAFEEIDKKDPKYDKENVLNNYGYKLEIKIEE